MPSSSTYLSWSLHGIGFALDMGSSVGLGKEQHVGMEQIILMKNFLADDGAFPP